MRKITSQEKTAVNFAIKFLDPLITNINKYNLSPLDLVSLSKAIYTFSNYPKMVIRNSISFSTNSSS